jgi:hypothetical protein
MINQTIHASIAHLLCGHATTALTTVVKKRRRGVGTGRCGSWVTGLNQDEIGPTAGMLSDHSPVSVINRAPDKTPTGRRPALVMHGMEPAWSNWYRPGESVTGVTSWGQP